MPQEVSSPDISAVNTQPRPSRENVQPVQKESLFTKRPDLQAHLLFAESNFIVSRDQIINKLQLPADNRWDWKKFQDASHNEKIELNKKRLMKPEEWKNTIANTLNSVKNEEITSLLNSLGVQDITSDSMQHLLDTYSYSDDGIQKFIAALRTNKNSAQQLPFIENIAYSLFGKTVAKDVVTQILDLESEIENATATNTLGTLAMKLAEASKSPSQETIQVLSALQSLLEAKSEQITNQATLEKASESQESVVSENAVGQVDMGKDRDKQQDSVKVVEGNLPRDIKSIALVADGHGDNGERASSTASEQFPTKLTQLLESNSTISIEDAIRQTIAEIDKDIPQQDGGTTFVAAIQLPDKVIIVNVGDSRAYKVSKDGATMEQITTDHNWPGKERRHNIMLARALGDKDIKSSSGGELTAQPDIFTIQPEKGETILLTSDGLTGVVSDAEIKTLIGGKSLQEAIQALIQAAKAKQNLADNLGITMLKIA